MTVKQGFWTDHDYGPDPYLDPNCDLDLNFVLVLKPIPDQTQPKHYLSPNETKQN